MGSSQSKEEVIVAGNSGGQSSQINGMFPAELTGKTIVEIVVLILAAIVILWYCYQRCKKRLEKKIREEIRASQEIA